MDVYTGAAVTGICDDCVKFKVNGEVLSVKANTVVMATGLRPNQKFVAEIQSLGIPVTVAGDASSGKIGFQNIREGFKAGLQI